MKQTTCAGLTFASPNQISAKDARKTITMTYPNTIEANISHTRPSWIALGDWQVRLETGELRRGQDQATLPDQSRKLLSALCDATEATATRAQLEAILWPAGGIGEESLNNAIARLRRSLGDDPANPKYIKTLPRRGYQLVADQKPLQTTFKFTSRLATRTFNGFAWIIGAFAALTLASHLFGVDMVEVHYGDMPQDEAPQYIRRG